MKFYQPPHSDYRRFFGMIKSMMINLVCLINKTSSKTTEFNTCLS